jgi:hypothetical protein
MVLKDLIGPAPMPAAERPPGMTCEKYTRGEGKRCIHDAANGACALPDEFMGVEWLSECSSGIGCRVGLLGIRTRGSRGASLFAVATSAWYLISDW